MKSMCLQTGPSARALTQCERPKPTPGKGELLIRVHAAGVTPSELEWYPTRFTQSGDVRVNAVPGHEFSGVVDAVGEGVTEYAAGDQIFGMNDWFSEGATAEHCVTVPAAVAFKPACLTHVQAASVPIGALTAWQALFTKANLQRGEQVFVQGGAGSVGMFAVQLGARHGACVVATASARNADFVRQLGASEVLDYRSDYLRENAGRFDAVLDVVGGETLHESWSLLKPGGRMVTIAAQSEGEKGARVAAAFFIVEPDREQLKAIAGLLDTGRLTTVVDQTVDFERAPDAYFGRLIDRLGRGKVVVQIQPS